MKKYPVRVFFNAYIDVEIEAKDSDTARSMAVDTVLDNDTNKFYKDLNLSVDFTEVNYVL